MTNEEALNHFKSLQKRYTTQHNGVMCEKVKVAIEAIEKQIPNKPKLLENELLLVAGWQYGCPNCGCACGENKYHEEVTDAEYYCTQCGQALDWSDE